MSYRRSRGEGIVKCIKTKMEIFSRFKNINYRRVAKFSTVGVVNFIIDFSVLNALSFITGLNKGVGAAVLGVISFLVANFASFHMNKSWTFKSTGNDAKYRKFLEASILGVAVNFVLVYAITEFLNYGLLPGVVLLNFSKLVATTVVAFINYHNYKKYVFNNPNDANQLKV